MIEEKGNWKDMDLTDVLAWLWLRKIYWLFGGVLFFAGAFLFSFTKYFVSSKVNNANFMVLGKYYMVEGVYAFRLYPSVKSVEALLGELFSSKPCVVKFKISFGPAEETNLDLPGKLLTIQAFLNVSSGEEAVSVFNETFQELIDILSTPYNVVHHGERNVYKKFFSQKGNGSSNRFYALAGYESYATPRPTFRNLRLKVSKLNPKKHFWSGSSFKKFLVKTIIVSLFAASIGAFLGVLLAGFLELIKGTRRKLSSVSDSGLL